MDFYKTLSKPRNKKIGKRIYLSQIQKRRIQENAKKEAK